MELTWSELLQKQWTMNNILKEENMNNKNLIITILILLIAFYVLQGLCNELNEAEKFIETYGYSFRNLEKDWTYEQIKLQRRVIDLHLDDPSYLNVIIPFVKISYLLAFSGFVSVLILSFIQGVTGLIIPSLLNTLIFMVILAITIYKATNTLIMGLVGYFITFILTYIMSKSIYKFINNKRDVSSD